MRCRCRPCRAGSSVRPVWASGDARPCRTRRSPASSTAPTWWPSTWGRCSARVSSWSSPPPRQPP
ncbi:MAG: hypothetical protein DIU79_07735, partial [Actinobacteria bacterium]